MIHYPGYAQFGEYVVFGVPPGFSIAATVSFPGYYYGTVFSRTS